MQQFLERKAGRYGPGSPAAASSKSAQLFSIFFCIAIAAYLALVFLPTLSDDVVGEGGGGARRNTVAPIKKHEEAAESTTHSSSTSDHKKSGGQQAHKAAVTEASPDDSSSNDDAATTADAAAAHDEQPKKSSQTDKKVSSSSSSSSHAAGKELTPWGYNKDRNVPRWKAIYKSIASDEKAAPGKAFTLVDYGADQGFFSISVAKFFPEAFVMGLEMGGVGGEIWKKNGKTTDVLTIQEGKLSQHDVNNMRICQTRVEPKHFFNLYDTKLQSDFQFVLSVFHWFKLPTREDFEKTVTTLFKNAKTTFIELPTIGDSSKLIRQQVGWEYFSKWYDGRTNVKEILEAACEAQGLKNAKVTRIASLKWVKWEREVYRVDSFFEFDAAPSDKMELFGCSDRQKIYGCNMTRKNYLTCP